MEKRTAVKADGKYNDHVSCERTRDGTREGKRKRNRRIEKITRAMVIRGVKV